METVRGILAAHPGGISRAGILAWAQLRIDPDFDAARLDAELAALGSEIVDRDGFLWLTSSAGALSAPARPTPEAPARPESDVPAPWSTGAETGTGDAWTEPGAARAQQPASWVEGLHPLDGGPGGGAGEEPVRTWSQGAAAGEGAAPAEDAAWGEGGTAATGGGAAIPGWSKPSGIVGSWATKIVALAIAVGFLISNLVGFLGDGDGSDATPGQTGPGPAMSGTLGSYEDLAVGDCMAVPTEDEFETVLFVPCTSPHDGEVFFVGAAPGSNDDYPDEAAFESFVDEACVPAFEAYTGSDFYEQESLDMGWFMPTADTWASGDHTVRCYLGPIDGSTTSVSWRDAEP